MDKLSSCSSKSTAATKNMLMIFLYEHDHGPFFNCLFFFSNLSQMPLEVLGHSKSFLPFISKDGFHFLVWSEPLFVLWVLQFVFLEIGPEMLHHLRPGHLLHLQPKKIYQVLGQLQWFGQAGSFWHFGARVRSVL